jgi:hypothetical protein
MDKYYLKYLKYKHKYLHLQLNGGKLEGENLIRFNEIVQKYKKDFTQIVYCDKRGFKQHQGECWNDSIQTLLCFSDGIKHMVQRKLFNLSADEIIEFAFLKERDKFLPYLYKYDIIRLDRLKIRLKNYIELLQRRLCLYIDPSLSIKSKSCVGFDECTLEAPESILVREEPKKTSFDDPASPREGKEAVGFSSRPPLARTVSLRIGVNAALEGLEISKDKDLIRKPKIEDETDHGGTHDDVNILFNLLSIIFLERNEMLKTDVLNIKHITETEINNAICCEITSNSRDRRSFHSTAFLNCNKKSFYYDDENGLIEFDWKKYLLCLVNNKEYIPVINLSFNTQPFFRDNKDNYYCMNSDGSVSKTDQIPGSLEENYSINDISHICFIKKIKLDNEIDYINKFADNLIKIEITKDNYRNIKRYIDNGLNIKYIDNSNNNLLHIVIENKCNEIKLVKYLIDNGVNVNHKNKYGDIPLHLVTVKNLDIIKLLIDSGSNILEVDNEGHSIFENLSFLNDVDIIKYLCDELIKKGINIKEYVEKKNSNGYNKLHYIISKDPVNVIKYLITTYNIDIKIKDSYGDNLLLNAVYYNSNNTVNYLIDNNLYPGFLQIKNNYDQNFLNIAVTNNNYKAITKLYNTLKNPDFFMINLIKDDIFNDNKPKITTFVKIKDTDYKIHKLKIKLAELKRNYVINKDKIKDIDGKIHLLEAEKLKYNLFFDKLLKIEKKRNINLDDLD